MNKKKKQNSLKNNTKKKRIWNNKIKNFKI